MNAVGYILGIIGFGLGEWLCYIKLQENVRFPFSEELPVMIIHYINLFTIYLMAILLLQWNTLQMIRQINHTGPFMIPSKVLTPMVFLIFGMVYPAVVFAKFFYYITLGEFNLYSIIFVTLGLLCLTEAVKKTGFTEHEQEYNHVLPHETQKGQSSILYSFKV
ncbi:hypothetical protein SAMN05421676_104250 [Salinibacillus kushneri]|uniref:Uncharacterized protein n=2 Tax=Salinibacillus kushneri TaxID=237682 RepID=A0A1I0E0E8_9BACI|nr:hypothetical protein SAMN05421676_104250 [Salinibacillus kushneri]